MVMISPHHLFHCLAGHAHGGAVHTLGRMRLVDRRWRPPQQELALFELVLYPESVEVIKICRKLKRPDFVGGGILS
jgi:hypothetical protein